MEQAILTEIIKYGGGIGILLALYLVLSKIAEMLKSRNGNGKFNELQKIVMNDYAHEFERIWKAIDKINDKLDNFERRVVKLEVCIKNNKGRENI
jgi:hypothetical protein